ncbi:MAG: phosphatase PAP2 family protein [Actinomycetota bacterium]|nr:phosphatase PAP2 family protein [Actinomycetota bacterium]
MSAWDTLVVVTAQGLPLAVVGLAALVWLTLPVRNKLRVALHGLVTLALTAGLVWLAGRLHTDPRPFAVDPSHPALFAHPADNGFPSDHTAFAVAAAFVVVAVRRRTGILLSLLGVLGGIARVTANVHHGQDIVAGVVIAGVAASLAAPLAHRLSASVSARAASSSTGRTMG